MFREARQRSTRKQLEKDRLDPKKSHKPEPPVSGPGNMLVIFTLAFMSVKLHTDTNKSKIRSVHPVSLGCKAKHKKA